MPPSPRWLSQPHAVKPRCRACRSIQGHAPRRTQVESAPPARRAAGRERLQRRPRVDRAPATRELVAPRARSTHSCRATPQARRARGPGPSQTNAQTSERWQRTSTDHAINPRPHGPSGAIGEELMTRAGAGREYKQTSRQRGLLRFSGRLSRSPGGLRLCVSSRAPSRAGRSPYNSEPSIEAPDSTTPSGEFTAKPQQSHTIPTTRP
jgi:hypothetical protein